MSPHWALTFRPAQVAERRAVSQKVILIPSATKSHQTSEIWLKYEFNPTRTPECLHEAAFPVLKCFFSLHLIHLWVLLPAYFSRFKLMTLPVFSLFLCEVSACLQCRWSVTSKKNGYELFPSLRRSLAWTLVWIPFSRSCRGGYTCRVDRYSSLRKAIPITSMSSLP